jgi:hypothetical protein
MTVAPSRPAHQDNGNRTARLPLVLMLVFGMMLSLIHCAGCDLHYSNDGPAIVVAMQATGRIPIFPSSNCRLTAALAFRTSRPIA